MKFLNINQSNIHQLEGFLQSCESEQTSFRYFKNRSINSINNHKITILVENDNELVGYGHLDDDGDKVWLGVMVKTGYQGQKIGQQIVQYLIDSYNGTIHLTVDKNNNKAYNLYTKLGFVIINENDKYYMMKFK